MDWTAIISGAISGGLIAGVVSLLLPSVQWRIEQRRERLKERKEFINNIRRVIADVESDWMESPEYRRLEGLIMGSAALRLLAISSQIPMLEKAINSDDAEERISDLMDEAEKILHFEITKLEQKWKII